MSQIARSKSHKLDPLDAALLRRQFRISDPDALENLSQTLPDDYRLAELEFQYDVTPSTRSEKRKTPRRWCAHCGKPKQWIGAVMRSPSGVRFEIGHDCGTELFDLDFNIQQRLHDEDWKRQRALRRRARLLEVFPDALAECRELSGGQALLSFEEILNEIKVGMPKLFGAICFAADHAQGRMTIDHRVRDYAAEARREDGSRDFDGELAQAEKRRANGTMTLTKFKAIRAELKELKSHQDQSPIYTTLRKDIGPISGIEAFCGENNLKAVVQTNLNALAKNYTHLAVETRRLNLSDFRRTFREIDGLIVEIENARARINALSKFLNPGHLRTLSNWMRARNPDDEYKVDNGWLVHNGPGATSKVKMRKDLFVKPAPALEKLKEALRAHKRQNNLMILDQR